MHHQQYQASTGCIESNSTANCCKNVFINYFRQIFFIASILYDSYLNQKKLDLLWIRAWLFTNDRKRINGGYGSYFCYDKLVDENRMILNTKIMFCFFIQNGLGLNQTTNDNNYVTSVINELFNEETRGKISKSHH